MYNWDDIRTRFLNITRQKDESTNVSNKTIRFNEQSHALGTFVGNNFIKAVDNYNFLITITIIMRIESGSDVVIRLAHSKLVQRSCLTWESRWLGGVSSEFPLFTLEVR